MKTYGHALLNIVYTQYFTKAIIEFVKVNVFLILRINLDSKILYHVKNLTLFHTVIKH